MLVSNPAPVGAVQPNDRLDFRPFQRVTAGVVQVTPTQAVLSVDGIPIVARLTDTAQAALLSEQRSAQFVVIKNSNQEIILKLIQPEPNSSPAANPAQQDLVTRLLDELNLPVDGEHILICRGLLNAKAPVTAASIQELAGVLAQLGDWDAGDAGLAAILKAAGLPLSALSIRLAAQTARPMAADMGDLAQKIQAALAQKGLPVDFHFMLETVGQLLAEVTIDPSRPREEIARTLTAQFELLGQSFEHLLGQQAGQSSPLWPEKSLMLVARFEQMARGLGFHDLADAARQLLDDVHFSQLLNAGKPADAALESWLTVPLTLRAGGQNDDEMDFSARLKIARYPDGEKRLAVDAENTRLVLQLDLAEGRSIHVQLVMHANQVRTDVNVTDDLLEEAARSELAGLKDGIEELGYQFFEGQVQVADVPPLNEVVRPENDVNIYQSIFLEI